jgi:ribonuclease HII
VLYYENKLKALGFDTIIGIDEAGRGPLAGPVVACAVNLLSTRFKNRIDDSKKLTAEERESAFPEIIGKSVFGIGIIDEKVIDRINILQATHRAMENALSSLLEKIDSPGKKRIHLLIDGNIILNTGLPSWPIIKGDTKSKSIACASIIAKVTRDRIMCQYDKVYPQYGFRRHKGYPTQMHKRAIRDFGPCRIHRVSFNSA